MSMTFGPLLKNWRERRRYSQLDLALAAEVSARHVSFMEQGRAQPSRAMVLRLARHLDVPLAERNALLNAAGFSAQYKARGFDAVDMQAVRTAVQRLLTRHAPYPGFAIDRHWRVVEANAAAAALFGALGLSADRPLYDVFLDPARAALFHNLDELKGHLAQRLMTESRHLGGDTVLERAAAALRQDMPADASASPGPPAATINTIIDVGGQRLALFGMIAQFGSTEDIALADLKIELMFPADAATSDWFEAAASSPSP